MLGSIESETVVILKENIGETVVSFVERVSVVRRVRKLERTILSLVERGLRVAFGVGVGRTVVSVGG